LLIGENKYRIQLTHVYATCVSTYAARSETARCSKPCAIRCSSCTARSGLLNVPENSVFQDLTRHLTQVLKQETPETSTSIDTHTHQITHACSTHSHVCVRVNMHAYVRDKFIMWIFTLFRQMNARKAPEVPLILKMGRRGANVKAWTFLRLNADRWFTAREVCGYLELPLSTVQLALRRVVVIAPLIQSKEIEVDQRGRREKQYRYQTN
jgi:predicted Co/Zn/Cd cation transporter (cation efflux family)